MTHDGEAAILAVDDNPDRIVLMSLLLRKAGYRVLTAGDGLEALEVARRERPLLVISDVSMPRASGIDLCRWLRADAELYAVPILLVSALRVDDASAIEGLQAGADDYLEAPYDPERLIAQVTRLVERARLEGKLKESEERYALAARGANDGLWDWNLRTGEIYFSARWKQMLGCGESEVGGRPEDWFDRVHPQDIDCLRAEIDAHIEGRHPHFEIEHRALHKDGDYRWMLSRGMVVRDGTGKATRMAGSQTDITERKLAEGQLLHDAFHDALTGLPNRALFMDRLGQAVERARRHPEIPCAVIFLDLDRFKIINDSLGHMVGDRLLVEIGRRLGECVRASDTVARLGGDEFTVLLDDIKETGDAIRMAERIQRRLALPYRLEGNEVFASASVGISLSAMGYEQPEEILRDANIAMHRAKSLGKSCYQVFDTTMHEQAVALLRLETDLRRTIERDEYCLHYQPIVALGSNRMTGFEALVRWRHPERGLLYPVDFLALAEETGLISHIDRWVLREACRQMREWQAGSPAARAPLSISVNLSAKQFSNPKLVEYVEQVLGETGLAPESLKLEITESVLMTNADSVPATLKRLKGLGVELYLDDFGTGYSSLSYLHNFPLDVIKIDRSFVGRIGPAGENAEIARAIVTMAHSLGMSVVAEGVETEEQLAELKGMGCEYGQGYLFSEPVDGPSSVRLLAPAASLAAAAAGQLATPAAGRGKDVSVAQREGRPLQRRVTPPLLGRAASRRR